MIDDPKKRIADAARTVKVARRIFADELEGIERLPLWDRLEKVNDDGV
jgi:hypothetical protein